jgi:hypothetical protein
MDPINVNTRILEMKNRMSKIAFMIDDLETYVKDTKKFAKTSELWPKDFTTKNFLRDDKPLLNAFAKEFTLMDLAAAAAAADRAAADAVCSKKK